MKQTIIQTQPKPSKAPKISDEDRIFIKDNYHLYTNKEFAITFKCSQPLINVTMRQLGLTRPNARTSYDERLKIANMLEEFWCGNMDISMLARKYGISVNTTSRYISTLFYKKLNEQTKVITLKSKV